MGHCLRSGRQDDSEVSPPSVQKPYWSILVMLQGDLVLRLYSSTTEDELGTEDVSVTIDANLRTVAAGDTVTLKPGEHQPAYRCISQLLGHR